MTVNDIYLKKMFLVMLEVNKGKLVKSEEKRVYISFVITNIKILSKGPEMISQEKQEYTKRFFQTKRTNICVSFNTTICTTFRILGYNFLVLLISNLKISMPMVPTKRNCFEPNLSLDKEFSEMLQNIRKKRSMTDNDCMVISERVGGLNKIAIQSAVKLAENELLADSSSSSLYTTANCMESFCDEDEATNSNETSLSSSSLLMSSNDSGNDSEMFYSFSTIAGASFASPLVSSSNDFAFSIDLSEVDGEEVCGVNNRNRISLE